MQKNGLIGKIKSISKFMTPQLRLQAIATDILSNISRCKDNQTMKLSELIEQKKYFSSKNIQKMRQGD